MISSFKDPKDKKSYEKQPINLNHISNKPNVNAHHSSNPVNTQRNSNIQPLEVD